MFCFPLSFSFAVPPFSPSHLSLLLIARPVCPPPFSSPCLPQHHLPPPFRSLLLLFFRIIFFPFNLPSLLSLFLFFLLNDFHFLWCDFVFFYLMYVFDFVSFLIHLLFFSYFLTWAFTSFFIFFFSHFQCFHPCHAYLSPFYNLALPHHLLFQTPHKSISFIVPSAILYLAFFHSLHPFSLIFFIFTLSCCPSLLPSQSYKWFILNLSLRSSFFSVRLFILQSLTPSF